MLQVRIMPTDKHGRQNDHTPPSNVKKKSKKTMCSVCDLVIVEDKDDAIFSEGKCQAWLHKHCTGMSKQRFGMLTKSDDPFVCLYCGVLCN